MKAQICPVCHGKGTVAPDFYPDTKSISRQKCRACGGSGVIICREEHYPWPRPEPNPPWPKPHPWRPPHYPYDSSDWCGIGDLTHLVRYA